MIDLSFFENNSPELKFARQIHEAVIRAVHRATVGLLAANMLAVERVGKIDLVSGPPHTEVGSGVLFTPDGKAAVLVTAGHVAKGFREPGHQIFVRFGSEPRPRLLVNDEGTVIDEENDVAVIRLTDAHAGYMVNAGAAFLNQQGILVDADLDGWHCLLSGHLSEGTTYSTDYQTMLLRRYNHWTTAFRGKVSSEKYSPQRHLLVSYSANTTSFDDGLPAEGPTSLGGMSGTSLWRAFHDEHLDRPWNIDILRSVGIQTHVYHRGKGDVVQCVKWRVIMPLVIQLCPEARTAVPQGWLEE